MSPLDLARKVTQLELENAELRIRLAKARSNAMDEAAAVCEAERQERLRRGHAKDPNYGQPMVQLHKAITCGHLADRIRRLKHQSEAA